MDQLHRIQTSNSGSHSENEALSSVNQLTSNLSDAQSQYKQYSDNVSRSHDLAEMASYASNLSADQQQNLDQQFVRYVENSGRADVTELLTNTDSRDIAQERSAIAESFMREEVLPNIQNDYNKNKTGLGDDLPNVTNTTGVDVMQHHENAEHVVASSNKGIPSQSSVSKKVKEMQADGKSGISVIKRKQDEVSNDLDKQYKSLKKTNKGRTNAATHNINNAHAEQQTLDNVIGGAGELIDNVLLKSK